MAQDPEVDFEFLANLEERIRKAVDVVALLKKENANLTEQLLEVMSAKEAAEKTIEETRADAAALRRELESLQSERKQVRTRIERLLGQMDALSAS